MFIDESDVRSGSGSIMFRLVLSIGLGICSSYGNYDCCVLILITMMKLQVQNSIRCVLCLCDVASSKEVNAQLAIIYCVPVDNALQDLIPAGL